MQAERHSALLRAILESPQDIVIFALDREYRYMAFNRNHAQTMQHIWGVELEVGTCMLDVIGREDDRARARANFDRALGGESFTLVEEYGDERIHRRVYENVYSPIYDDHGSVIGLTVYLTDVTEQRRAEQELDAHRNRLEELVAERTRELEAAHAQLLYVQKLESLGVLAGGIAHDFNNLLAVILGRAELARGLDEANKTTTAGMLEDHLRVIIETALEARSLTRQLLGYAGRGKFVVEPTILASVVEDLEQVLRASVRKSILLEYDLSRDMALVEVDVTQVRQVLLNLVSNAADAIGETRGTIVVRTYETSVDSARLSRSCVTEPLPPGRYAALEVEDTGGGMDARVRERLFDPFFTTKRAGRGLGLAAVYGIVTSHRGCILLDSSQAHGTRFTLLFPRSEASAASLGERGSTLAPSTSSLSSGTVLVVDDEEPVRLVAEQMLASAGYEVEGAAGGREALKAFRSSRAFSLVLLDLTMPHMDGQETLRGLRELRESVPVVLMTGYTEREAYLPHMQDAIDGFLAKPFSRRELVRAVTQALSGSDAAQAPERVVRGSGE